MMLLHNNEALVRVPWVLRTVCTEDHPGMREPSEEGAVDNDFWEDIAGES